MERVGSPRAEVMAPRLVSVSESTPDAGPRSPPVDPSLADIFERELDYVFVTLRRFGVADRDLDDFCQEVFLRVHAQLAQYDASRPLRPWLLGIALGVASNYGRLARHRADLVAAIADVSDPGQPADERLAEHEERALVHEALQRIPMHHRAVLILHEMDGFPIPEVALALGIGTSTAYSRLRLGRDAFRGAMTRLLLRRSAR